MARALCGLVVAALAACATTGGGPRSAATRVTLYRDGAFIEEQVEISVDADGVGTLPLIGPAATAELTVDSPDGSVLSWTRLQSQVGDPVSARLGATTVRGRRTAADDAGIGIATDGAVVIVRPEQLAAAPPTLRVVTRARDRKVPLVLRYATDRIGWAAHYTLLDRGGRAQLRGAVTVDNRSGRSWPAAAMAVIDAPLTGGESSATTWAYAHPLSLGPPVELGVERQLIPLGLGAVPVVVRSMLTYDPVTTALDTTIMSTDPELGRVVKAERVDASISVELPPADVLPLPAGPVNVVAIDSSGALAWRGQIGLPGATASAARTVAIAIGTAPEVTGRRQQTMFDFDPARERIVEEIKLTLTNHSHRPVQVVAREHLYRGLCWTLAYYSTPAAAWEGPQQVRMVASVPADGTTTVVYRVVYKQNACPP